MPLRTVLLLPYPNPHFLGLFDALASDSRFKVDVVCFGEESRFRRNFSLGSTGLSPVKLFSKRGLSLVWKSKVVIVHGLFYWYVLFVSVLLRRKHIFFTSEPINPAMESPRKLLVRRLIIGVYKVVLKNMVVLSCGGGFLKKQLLDLGLACPYYKFGLFPRVLSCLSVSPLKDESSVHFSFVGQFIPRKNLKLLIEAIKVINADLDLREKYRFYFVGGGEELNDVLELSKLYDNIFYLGVMKQEEVRNFLMTWSHVLILPSLFDGWGAVVNEAVYSGNAILATRYVYSSTLYLQEGVNGFYIDSHIVADLVAKMKTYINDRRTLNEHRLGSLEVGRSNTASGFVPDLYNLSCGRSDTTVLQPLC